MKLASLKKKLRKLQKEARARRERCIEERHREFWDGRQNALTEVLKELAKLDEPKPEPSTCGRRHIHRGITWQD